MKFMTKSKIILTKAFIVSCLSFFLVVSSVSAAEMSIQSVQSTFSVGNNFSLDINLDTQSESVNAIEGELIFDDSILELKEVKDGNSQINFWVDKPKLISAGRISFSGITPGGLLGKDKFLFSVVFSPKKIGSSLVTLNNLKVLKNDGRGTLLKTESLSFKMSVYNQESSQMALGVDSQKPEDFKIYLGQDNEIFSGQSFLVFSTQDKDSGIDHYEIKEGFWSDYTVGKSPYLLENQSLSKTIYVKAVDKSGNERVVSFNPKTGLLPYQWYLILGILLVTCIFTFKKIKTKFFSK